MANEEESNVQFSAYFSFSLSLFHHLHFLLFFSLKKEEEGKTNRKKERERRTRKLLEKIWRGGKNGEEGGKGGRGARKCFRKTLKSGINHFHFSASASFSFRRFLYCWVVPGRGRLFLGMDQARRMELLSISKASKCHR